MAYNTKPVGVAYSDPQLDSLSVTGDATVAGTLTATVTGNITGNLSGSVGSVTGAVGSVTSGVTVTTNNDKTGYSLATAPPTAAAIADASALPALSPAATAARRHLTMRPPPCNARIDGSGSSIHCNTTSTTSDSPIT